MASNFMKDKGVEVFQDFEHHSKDRYNFDNQYKEIAERMIPAHSNQFNTFTQNLEAKGQKRTEEIFDATASIALGRFASILDSLLTPKNQKWQRLRADNDNLNNIKRVNLWFEDVTRLLFKYRYAPRANFASQNNQVWKSIGAYGTGGLFIDDAVEGFGMRYKNIHLSQLYIVENHQGIVDKVFRYFSMTLRQAYQKWGDKLPKEMLTKLEQSPAREFFFIHRVQPNEKRDPTKIDAAGMAYESCYISVEGKHVLEEGGYNSWPYPVSRYEIAPGETYGRSPAMEVLPAVKTLNEQKKTVLKQGHRAVDPIILAHDDGVVDTFSLKPGHIQGGGVSADGRPLITTLPVGNIAIGKDLMDDERQAINDAFFITLFQILVESPQMTATEVMERVREKGMLLSPTIGRQESEYLGQVTERELDILLRQGALPPIPPELAEARGEYRIVYESPLARAARAEEATGIMRTIEAALNIAAQTQDPSVMDHFDFDVIIPDIGDIQGAPSKYFRSFEQIQSIRQSRAEAAQAQEDIQAAPGNAAMLKAVNEVENAS